MQEIYLPPSIYGTQGDVSTSAAIAGLGGSGIVYEHCGSIPVIIDHALTLALAAVALLYIYKALYLLIQREYAPKSFCQYCKFILMVLRSNSLQAHLDG